MPLSEDVRRELAAIEPQRDCDRLAELSGLFHTAGSLHLLGHGEFSVHLDVSESAVARRAFGLLRSFGVETEIRTYRRRAFDSATRYQLHVSGDARALKVLHEAGVLSAAHAPPRGTAETRGRTLVLPPGVPARRFPRRWVSQRAPGAPLGDPERDSSRR